MRSGAEMGRREKASFVCPLLKERTRLRDTGLVGFLNSKPSWGKKTLSNLCHLISVQSKLPYWPQVCSLCRHLEMWGRQWLGSGFGQIFHSDETPFPAPSGPGWNTAGGAGDNQREHQWRLSNWQLLQTAANPSSWLRCWSDWIHATMINLLTGKELILRIGILLQKVEDRAVNQQADRWLEQCTTTVFKLVLGNQTAICDFKLNWKATYSLTILLDCWMAFSNTQLVEKSIKEKLQRLFRTGIIVVKSQPIKTEFIQIGDWTADWAPYRKLAECRGGLCIGVMPTCMLNK